MDGWIKIGTKVDTKSFDKQIEELEGKIEDLEAQKISFTKSGESDKLLEVNVQLEKAKNKLIQLEKQNKDLGKTSSSSFNDINKSMEGVFKKVSKWALAIFSVRSAYSLVRRSVSTLSQEDENLSAQLQYISWVLAQTIAPIVKFIVNLVYMILQYINQITQSLFGLKLFKGPDEFAKSMKKASGSAKEIQKTLAGFDEKNVLNQNVRGAGGGTITPEFDAEYVNDAMTKMGDGIKKLGKSFRKEVQDMYDALDNPQVFKDAYGNWDQLVYGITEIFAGLGESIIGIFDMIKGWSKIITGLINGDWNTMVEGIKQVWKGTFEFLKGIWTMIVGAFDTIIGGIKGVVLSVWDYIVDKFTSLKSILTIAFSTLKTTLTKPFKALKTIAEEVLNWISEKLGLIGDALDTTKEALSNTKSAVSKYTPTGIASNLGQKLGSYLKGKLGFASGGIINNPGRGVPLTSAVGGEQGAEGIIPLSNTQAMEQLGETIGRYITINLTNTTELDGSIIARRVSKINQENNFARNR